MSVVLGYRDAGVAGVTRCPGEQRRREKTGSVAVRSAEQMKNRHDPFLHRQIVIDNRAGLIGIVRNEPRDRSWIILPFLGVE